LAVITALTKILSAGWAAKRAGIARPGRLRAGTVMVSRGEFNIVIAGLATSAGLIAPSFGPLSAAYVLLMAIGGPLIARAGDPLGRWAAKRWPAAPKPTRIRRPEPEPESTADPASDVDSDIEFGTDKVIAEPDAG